MRPALNSCLVPRWYESLSLSILHVASVSVSWPNWWPKHTPPMPTNPSAVRHLKWPKKAWPPAMKRWTSPKVANQPAPGPPSRPKSGGNDAPRRDMGRQPQSRPRAGNWQDPAGSGYPGQRPHGKRHADGRYPAAYHTGLSLLQTMAHHDRAPRPASQTMPGSRRPTTRPRQRPPRGRPPDQPYHGRDGSGGAQPQRSAWVVVNRTVQGLSAFVSCLIS